MSHYHLQEHCHNHKVASVGWVNTHCQSATVKCRCLTGITAKFRMLLRYVADIVSSRYFLSVERLVH